MDTTAREVRDVVQLWSAYLADPERRGRSERYWAREDRARLSPVDVAGSLTYDSAFPRAFLDRPGVILAVQPSVPPEAPGYVIRTKLGGYVAIVEVFASRETGGWRLSNALTQRTRAWSQMRIGDISYVVGPNRRFQPARAEQAARFIDSLASALGEPKPSTVLYVLADNPGAAGRVTGAEGNAVSDAFAQTANNLIVTGLDEFHAHELAHVVLKRWTGPAHAHLLMEGAATWAAAPYESDFTATTRELADSLNADSTLTLARAGAPRPWRRQKIGYAAGAILCQLAYERGGAAALRDLLSAGPGYDAVLGAAARALRVPASQVPVIWRRRALEYGK